MQIKNMQMEENGTWRGQVVIDGQICGFICSTEFIQDRLLYNTMLDTIKTGPFTEEEIADWQKYDKIIGDPTFWEGSRSRVKILKESND